MAATYIRESTISRATDYLNQIRRLVEKNPVMSVSDMKREATKMHIGTTYIDQAIALGYFSRTSSGNWKVNLTEGRDFTSLQAKTMIEKSNEYNRIRMRERSRRKKSSETQKQVTAPLKVSAPIRKREVDINDKYIEKYLTDKVILEHFLKKRLISNLDLCILTAELHRRGLEGTLSGSIRV